MSINDLVAFATGVRFAIDTIEMIEIDDELALRTGIPAGENWLAVRGFRHTEGSELPVCWTEVYINRDFAAVGRLLQRHIGPIFHLIEDLFGQSIVEVHQEIAGAGGRAQSQDRRHRARDAAHLQARDRKDRAGRDQYPSSVALSPFHDDAPGQGLLSPPLTRFRLP